MSKDATPEPSQQTPRDDNQLELASLSPQVDKKLESILARVPEPEREEVRHTVHEVIRDSFLGIIQGGSPRIDAETARIITESINKDNTNKFQFLTQKQADEAAQSKRNHEFAVMRHQDQRKMLWPCLITILVMASGCIIAGIYLSATGHEMLGSNLLTAILTALLAFLGGLGTAHFFKD